MAARIPLHNRPPRNPKVVAQENAIWANLKKRKLTDKQIAAHIAKWTKDRAANGHK